MGRKLAGANTVTVATGGATITEGKFYLLEGYFGLAVQASHPAGGIPRTEVNLDVSPGVYEFDPDQVTQGDTFAKGAEVYWDATNKKITTSDGGGANRRIGRVENPKDAQGVVWVFITNAN